MCCALVFNLSIIFMLPIFHAVKFNTDILALYIMHQSDWPNRLLYAVAVLPIFWHYSSFPVLSLSWTLDAARNDHTPKCQDLFTKTVVELSTTAQSPSLSAPGRPDIFLGSETQKKRPVKKKVQDMGFKK